MSDLRCDGRSGEEDVEAVDELIESTIIGGRRCWNWASDKIERLERLVGKGRSLAIQRDGGLEDQEEEKEAEGI